MLIRSAVISALHKVADPERARQQQAYMKSSMPYLGIPVPLCRRIATGVFKVHPIPNAHTWEEVILHLWRSAEHREERYAAIDLLHFRRYEEWLAPTRLPMIEEMVVTGAWWDFIDGIAARGVGRMLANHPRSMKTVMRDWARDDDIWKRRVAILCQLKARESTDKTLLVDTIMPSIGSTEFFLRKGIGWALREYSKTDPDWVREFVSDRPDLSGLTRREALKHLVRTRKGN